MDDRRRDARLREVVRSMDKDFKETLTVVKGNYEDLRRIVLKGFGLLTVALLLMVGAAAWQFVKADQRDQRNRFDAIVARCEALNATNLDIRNYLTRRDPDGLAAAEELARTDGRSRPFPVEPDCRKYAKQFVD